MLYSGAGRKRTLAHDRPVASRLSGPIALPRRRLTTPLETPADVVASGRAPRSIFGGGGDGIAMPRKKRRNLFYALLLPVGVAFVVTAFAYGLMAFQAVNATAAEATKHSGHALFQWLRAHGDSALLAELVALAVLTVSAIATERDED